MRLISACEVVGPGRLADEDAFGIAARVFEHLRVDQAVDDEHIGFLQALHGFQSEEFGIARAAADQRDPARVRWGRNCRRPAHVVEFGGKNAIGLVLRTSQDGAAERALQQPLPEPATRRGGRRPLWRRCLRSSPARFASDAEVGGKERSSRVLISRARTGAAPSVPIATVTGARSTIAGVMKVESPGASTTLTGIAAGLGCARHGGIEHVFPVAA